MPGLCGSELSTDWIFSFMTLSEGGCDDTPFPAALVLEMWYMPIVYHNAAETGERINEPVVGSAVKQPDKHGEP